MPYSVCKNKAALLAVVFCIFKNLEGGVHQHLHLQLRRITKWEREVASMQPFFSCTEMIRGELCYCCSSVL